MRNLALASALAIAAVISSPVIPPGTPLAVATASAQCAPGTEPRVCGRARQLVPVIRAQRDQLGWWKTEYDYLKRNRRARR